MRMPECRSLIAIAVLALAGCWSASPAARPAPEWMALAPRDGARAGLYRYPSPRAARRAVLLLPDVGATHALYDHGGRGLAPYLASRGLEAFVLEYRGTGRAGAPERVYTLTDLLDLDAEAALARALEGHAEVVVVGCGLGGAVGFALAARHPKQVPAVAGLQAAAALGAQSEPIAELLGRADELPEWIDLASASAAPLFGARSWFDVMLANDGGIAQGERESLRRALLAPMPRTLVQELARGSAAGRLELSGRDVRESARGYPGRALLVFAPRDNWIHLELSTPWRDVLAPERTRVKLLSAVEGARRDYGHLGMLLALSAERDVFAPLYAFAAEGT